MLMLGRKPVSPLWMPYAGFEKATNCLLEVPQNIKMTLENNVLTIKARSIITLTGSTYATLTTNVDGSITLGNGSDNSFYIIMTGNPNAVSPAAIYPVKLSSSGDSNGFPTENLTNLTTYYNTDDKIWYHYNPTTTLWDAISRYPLGIIERKNNIWSFAKDDNGNDIIFNDFSIIGHHYIGYPNNNLALGCDGFNTDGSYKTTYIHRNALYIFELPKAYVSYILHPNGTLYGGGYDPNSQSPYEEVNELPTTYVAANIYVKDENQVYRWSNGDSAYQIQNNSLYYGYINLSSDGIFRSMAIQQPLTKYRWVVKLIP